jgi:hypothetical protein
MYRAISLGWGVQSFVLSAMSALGELPMVDAAIHADTEHEMEATYTFAAQWTPWLEERGVKVATVRNEGRGGTKVSVEGGRGGEIVIPAFTIENGKQGRIRRQCTHDWKVDPVRRYLQAHRSKQQVELWLGITTDEWQRAKDADVKYITHRFPLLEMGMSRSDCIKWLEAHNLPSPGKSSCTFCPFHNKAAWQNMKRAGGADWQEAINVDAMIRNVRPPGELFVHPKAIPLADAVVIPEDYGYSQLDLLASDDEDAECDSGHCFL